MIHSVPSPLGLGVGKGEQMGQGNWTHLGLSAVIKFSPSMREAKGVIWSLGKGSGEESRKWLSNEGMGPREDFGKADGGRNYNLKNSLYPFLTIESQTSHFASLFSCVRSAWCDLPYRTKPDICSSSSTCRCLAPLLHADLSLMSHPTSPSLTTLSDVTL